MKKKLSLLLAILLIFMLAACELPEITEETHTIQVKATITDKDGNSLQMSAEELADIYEENEAKYESKYQGAKATITGTVESVESRMEYFGSQTRSVYVITLQEGWEITVLESDHPEVIDFSRGTKVKVTSKLQLVSYSGVVSMMAIGSHGVSDFYDNTVIRVVD